MADDPQELVSILDTDEAKRRTLDALFVRYITRRDIAALVEGLKNNRDLVCRLVDRGLFGAEMLFIFDRRGAGAAEYERWLSDQLRLYVGNDEQLASFVQFVLAQGRDLLEQMNTDGNFRECFRDELWPKFVSVVERKDDALEHYIDAPHLWQLLAHPRGEELLRERGLLAARLLYGRAAYPKEMHDRVIDILLSGNEITFRALVDSPFRHERKFHRLLQRQLPEPVLATALNRLFNKGQDYQPLLETYDRLSDEALKEELGPPPAGLQTWIPFHDQYILLRKLS